MTALTEDEQNSADYALTLTDITKSFGSDAGVFNITTAIPDYGVTALIGPNGSGKTTLFSIISGLLEQDSGTLHTAPHFRLAYCSDVPGFDTWLTATDVVQESLALSGLPYTDEQVATALNSVGLSKVARRKASDFSRGMLQRLGIACGLVLNPDLLIMDEPTSALDPIGKTDIKDLILTQKASRSILVSSHSLAEVESIADYLIVLKDGKIVTQGPAQSVIAAANSLPSWTLNFSQDFTQIPALVSMTLPSEATLDQTSERIFEVTYPTFQAGESNLPDLILSFNAPLVEAKLTQSDLDSAFARIIRSEGASE